MATKLTSEQRDDLQQHGNKPVPVTDPDTDAIYFLGASELFDRIRPLLVAEPFDLQETLAAQSEIAGRSGWNDPEMDLYDNYDAKSVSRRIS